MSRVTNELLAPFVGGQIEIQADIFSDDLMVFRGELAALVVDGDEIKFTMTWMAQCEWGGEWVKHDRLEYAVRLLLFAVTNAGPGETGGDRLVLESPIMGERVTLFPPDGSRLDPQRVKGLKLPG
jgi:hypothetical protein